MKMKLGKKKNGKIENNYVHMFAVLFFENVSNGCIILCLIFVF